MASPQPDVAELLDVPILPGGTVLAVSDLHLPPQRTDVSGRSCEILASRLAAQAGPVTVILAGDVIELLGYPQATAAEILREHEDLCSALTAVTERGGQVVYAIGNHDSVLAWDVKAADAVRELTGARLCLAADVVLADGGRVRVEHGHQLDPYNCFHDPRNCLDTPLGHHIVREVLPRVEWLGRDWLTGAHEMADPTDFPSFVGSRLVYRKLVRHAWWLLLLPVVLLILLRIPEIVALQSRYPDTTRWVHGSETLGYGAAVDLVVVAAVIAVLARRAWTSISNLALDERGYGQNRAARQRAADLTGDGYRGFLSGHTHHPELRAAGGGFYANTGSCTTVVESIGTRFGMPPAYLRTQQICWVEIAGGRVELMSARIELPGATRLERFAAAGHGAFSATPARVASWPAGQDWPGPAGEDRRPGRADRAGPPPAAPRTEGYPGGAHGRGARARP
jgi:UDP-2,3-diacylglucosamine pyrophosphatase LpxH